MNIGFHAKDEDKIGLNKPRYFKKALPILEQLGQWLQTEYPRVLPKSAIGKAIAYSLQRWKTLSAYVHYGMAEIDNNLIENQVRPLALGRKTTSSPDLLEGPKMPPSFTPYSLLPSSTD